MPSSAQIDSLTGVLERIKYSNEEDGYLIGELRPEDQSQTVIIVGKFPGIQCGETLRIQGSWTNHPAHGRQFKASAFKSELPASVYGIRKYLGSGLVKGVSKGLANRIVKRFGEKTLKVISEESARLQEVEGIGSQRAKSIKRAWEEQSHIRDLSLFLNQYGVTPSQIVKIHKEYGFTAIDLINENPYRLARDIAGIGFKTCDRMAINMGLANDGPRRVEAGILYALQNLQDEGHTAYPAKDLVALSAESLETDREVTRNCLVGLFEKSELRRVDLEDGSVYSQLPYNSFAEEKIEYSANRLLGCKSSLPPIRIEKAIEWAEEKAGIAFADQQKEAIRNALENKLFVLTGGPGTGKTTILRAIVSILKAKKSRILLAAPTGRAAQRLAETTGGFAQTIHRLLKYDPAKSSFTMNESKPLGADVIIIDEASMLDGRLASCLFQATPSDAHLILVGDTDQLPSVGAGNVLGDLIQWGQIPVTRLNVVFRQSKQSSIVYYAHSVNSGEPSMPTVAENVASLDTAKDFQFLVSKDQEDCSRKVLATLQQFVEKRLGIDPIKETQVLAPMHRGAAGVGQLNALLQSELNSETDGLQVGYIRYKKGDKVIQTRNNYDKGVFNGDVGIVSLINRIDGSMEIEFDNERLTYDMSDMLDLSLAYSVSIHKSQGSEYPVVVIPLLKAHFMMLQRNLIYTAITRGKKKVILIGDPAAYAMAVRNSDSKARCTLLKKRLLGSVKED